jgi:aspartate/methionine/tyrosine aminotransferase
MRFNAHVLQTEMPPLVELPRRAAELAAGGADVIRVDQGAVDMPPPERFLQRVREVLGGPEVHRYTPDPGLPELRSALARYAAERLGVECDPERELIVTAGANEAGFVALVALLEPGDEVLLPSPWYFNHAMTLSTLGAVPVPIPTVAEQGWVPEPDVVAGLITPRTRGIALVNPNNPTGAVYDDQRIRQLVEIAIEKDLWILADQTYHELYFGAKAPVSPAAISGARERVITVSSFSKSLGLAGWRLGFLTGPAALVDQVLKVHDCSVICAGRAGQEGLLAALPEAGAHTARVRDTLRFRRDRLMASLEAAGLTNCVEPGGSLFLFLRLPAGTDDRQFCRSLLEERHVVAVPGSAFGPGGEGFVRISFGSIPAERLEEAINRIASVL